MAVTHSVAARNAIANAIAALVSVGSVYPSGRLLIFDDDGNLISTQFMAFPAEFLAAVNGSAFANPIQADNNPVVGAIPASYQVTDRNGNVIFEGTCGPDGDLGCVNGPITMSCFTSNFAYNAPA